MSDLDTENSIQQWIKILGANKDSITQSDLINLLESLLECIPEGVEVTDENRNILYVNENLEKVTGFTRDIRLGKNIFEVNPKSLLARVLREGREITNTITTAPEMNGEGVATPSPIF